MYMKKSRCGKRVSNSSFSVAIAVRLLLLVAPLSISPLLVAQSFYGSIVGTVNDSTGAVVPGATVTVTNLGTNEKHSMNTDAAGGYRFVSLVPANYKVDVEAKSFKRFVQASATVPVDATVRVDATLQVGEITEVVEVSSAPPLLQTDSGSISAQVEGQIVQEMPMNGRNVMNLINIVPSVVPQGGASGAIQQPSTGKILPVAWANMQIGGSIGGYETQYIDGAPVMIMGQNQIGLIPVQDIVQEFKVDTNAVSAEFGRYAGGVIEMTTKSGTNQFHATAYEYFRNTLLNANAFFTKFVNGPRAFLNLNQYGFTGSGPILKNKVFLFGGFEKYVLRTRSTTSTNVPDATMNSGVFSKAITDPSGTCKTKSGTGILKDTPQVGQYTIPKACFDSTSQVMAGYFPAPNSTSNFNWVNTTPGGNDTRQWTVRGDYNMSQKNRLFGRYTAWQVVNVISPRTVFNNYNNFFIPNLPGRSGIFSKSSVLGDTYTINPSTILDLRASYLWQHYPSISAVVGRTDMSRFGPAWTDLAKSLTVSALPEAIFGGSHSLYNMTAVSGLEDDIFNDLSFDASLVKIIGSHSLKVGGEIYLMERSGYGNNPNAGTQAIYKNGLGVGDEYAAFLMGEFDSINVWTYIPTTMVNWSQAVYATDTWQVNRKLTLNYGLRWELPNSLYEKKDRNNVNLPGQIDPVTGFPGAVVLVNSPLWPHRGVEPNRYIFVDPRFGFAYRLPASAVVRGGYAISFAPPDMPSGVMAFNSPTTGAITNNINTAGPNMYFQSNPFPATPGQVCPPTCTQSILQPAGRANPNFVKNLAGQIAQAVVPTSAYPYFQQWNLSFSKQWKGDWLTEAAYLGGKGVHLAMQGKFNYYTTTGLNQIPSAYYDHTAGMALTGPDYGKLITAPSTVRNAACQAYGTALGKTPSVGQCLTPYPQFQDYQNGADYSGSSIYHAMTFVATKRFHGAGVLTGNWTWGRLISDADVVDPNQTDQGIIGYIQDFNNKRAERSLSTFAVRHRVNIVYSLGLPFGRGQKFLNSGGIVNAIVGGWGLNGITTFQSGFPIPIEYSSNTLVQNFASFGTLRPNYVPGCQKKTSGTRWDRFVNGNSGNTTNAWFNSACFTNPGPYALGNEPRVDPQLQYQGIDNWDFSVAKDTKIKERMSVAFRMEFFNLWNHTQFRQPGTIMAGSNYDKITAVAGSQRLAQASLRVSF
jgi:hypothetical protein